LYLAYLNRELVNVKNGNRRTPALAIFLLVLFIVQATAVFAATGPTFPEPVGYVNDFAGVMSSAQKTQLEATLKELQQTTGAEIAVVTLKSTQPLVAKDYAIQLMEKWQVGQKGKDNGIILLAAIDDRQVTIEVGYGLEGAITDAIAGRILDQDLIPQFKNNNYGAGLIAATQSLIVRVKQEAGVIPKTATPAPAPSRPATNTQGPAIVALIVVGLAFILIMSLIARATRPKCPKCKGKCIVTDKVITPATALTAGVGVRVCKCLECGLETESQYRIPPIIVFGGRGWGGGGFGGGFGGRGGGFGGFGGGSSGGGGASRSW
jgi:uncharacterized protein